MEGNSVNSMQDTMESHFKSTDCRKRRRSSIENEIMQKRLQEWRAKKGLPTRSKLQEERENQKPRAKHITPNHPLKRKSVQICKSERRLEKTDDNGKKTRSHTPGDSSHQVPAFNRRQTCSSLRINKQPGRRSLAPSTRMNTAQQSFGLKLNRDKERVTCNKKTSLPSKKLDIPSLPVPQQDPIKLHNVSQELCVQGKKSVQFLSPKMQTAEISDENIPTTTCISEITPEPTKLKLGLRERLEKWLIAKGKTPARFKNFLGYGSSTLHSTPADTYKRRRSGTPHLGKNRRDTPGKLESSNDAVHRTMKECLEMVEEGCPLEDMSSWLDGMVIKVPLIQQCAGYWLCRAKIAEKQTGDQSAIECLFEAVEFNPEPVKDILDTLATYRLKLKLNQEESTDPRCKSLSIQTGAESPLRHSPFLKDHTCTSNTPVAHTPVAHLRFEEEDVHQSPEIEDTERQVEDTSHLSIKYSLKETTPYFARIHQTPGHSSTTPCLLVTPVRRSARLDDKRRSVASLGTQLTHTPAVDECLDSMGDIAASYPTAQLILRPNRALSEEFDELN